MASTTEARVAVITGGSSGIGLNAARALRDRGLNVYELSRRADRHSVSGVLLGLQGRRAHVFARTRK